MTILCPNCLIELDEYRYCDGCGITLRSGEMGAQPIRVESVDGGLLGSSRLPAPPDGAIGHTVVLDLTIPGQVINRIRDPLDHPKQRIGVAFRISRADIPVIDYYFLTSGNTLDDAFPRRHFKTLEAARRAADKLNSTKETR
jgi:hypothetical protein